MGLGDYNKKRKFSHTPEPKGKTSKHQGPLTFVVQKHHATALHYDFRLEMDGVLKSWAVPKGPSLNPEDKRLAVEVEDHPLDYAKFEGVIPKGNYGAGTVKIWDKGVYAPLDAVDRKEAEKILLQELKKGHITFVMLGEKLKGEFALIKTHGENEKAWLLVKKGDEYASKKDVTEDDDDKMPTNVSPMLATAIEEPFDKDGWIFEMKWDGYRAISEIKDGEVKLYSRNKIDFNKRFEPVVEALEKLKINAVLDGEIVVVDEEGKPNFGWMQDYPKSVEGELRYYVFDILYLDGKNLESLPLIERKKILKDALAGIRPPIFYSEHIEKSGKEFFLLAAKQKLEGIMAKDEMSVYQRGVRSKSWLKIKSFLRQEAVICGFTKPKGGRKHFGALVLGIYRKNKLYYVGHTGGGFDDKRLKSVLKKLQPLVVDECPFDKTPKTNAPVTWVRPELVCEVTFREWTKDFVMRQPIFIGLREDKETDDVKVEKIETFKNLDKVFWPKEGYTKGDLVFYYEQISKVILPYLKDRPESLLRYPHGIEGESFFQKDGSQFNAKFLKKTKIYSESNEKHIEYLLCQDKQTLLYLINLGCIDLNPWNSSIGSLDKPDYIIIDLDPEDISFDQVIKVAQAAREVLEELGIKGYPKTSGARGMHIYIPMEAQYSYEQARQFCELLCIQIHQKTQEITSMVRSPNKRQGKVYLDYLQNAKGQTLASVYSVRAKNGATVSAPLEWDEIKKGLTPLDFTIKNMLKRLDKKGDLFKGVLGKGVDIKKVLKKLEG